MLRVWIWADQQSVDGNALSVTKTTLDRISSISGLASAMVNVGWLKEKKGKFSIPNFNKHNGKSAKKRALTNKRVKDLRETGHKGNAPTVTDALPEKRIEENKEQETPKVKKPVKRFVPPTLDEAKAYFAEKRCPHEAENFFDYYESKGWLVGKAKMQKWRSSASKWIRTNKKESGPTALRCNSCGKVWGNGSPLTCRCGGEFK